jgi:hypothetical protein
MVGKWIVRVKQRSSDFPVRNSPTYLWFNQPVLDGKPRKLCVVSKIELCQQTRSISVHCLYAEAVGIGDLPVCPAHGKTPENLDFPVGKVVKRGRAALAS